MIYFIIMMTKDKAITAMDKSGSFRIYMSISTAMAETAREIHGTTPVATAALSRVLTAASLMGIMMQDDTDKVTLQFKGDGPAHEILATAYGSGRVKGYISNPDLELALRPDGKLDVGSALGIGQLTCIRDIGLKEPYMGKIDLVSGEIADDLTAYFFVSDQKSSSVILSETIAMDGTVESAAGLIIQMLPNCDPKSVDELERILEKPEPLAKLASKCREEALGEAPLSDDGLAESILRKMLREFFREIMPEYAPEETGFRDIGWNCDCSRERIEQVLLSLGENELTTLINEDNGAELTCQFCRSQYKFTKEELINLIQEGRKKKC